MQKFNLKKKSLTQKTKFSIKIMYFTHELTYVKLLLRLRLFIIVSRRDSIDFTTWVISVLEAQTQSGTTCVASIYSNKTQPMPLQHISTISNRSAITMFLVVTFPYSCFSRSAVPRSMVTVRVRRWIILFIFLALSTLASLTFWICKTIN